MAKVSDVRVDELEAQFQTGKRPPQESYWDIFKAIQEAAQEHEHVPDGGPGSGTGDACPVAFLAVGLDEDKSAEPLPGEVFVAIDTTRFYLCFELGVWTIVFDGGAS